MDCTLIASTFRVQYLKTNLFCYSPPAAATPCTSSPPVLLALPPPFITSPSGQSWGPMTVAGEVQGRLALEAVVRSCKRASSMYEANMFCHHSDRFRVCLASPHSACVIRPLISNLSKVPDEDVETFEISYAVSKRLLCPGSLIPDGCQFYDWHVALN